MTQDVSPGCTWTTRECYGKSPKPTRFSLRPPLEYNPRTPNQLCSLILDSPLKMKPWGTSTSEMFGAGTTSWATFSRPNGTQVGEGSPHANTKAPILRTPDARSNQSPHARPANSRFSVDTFTFSPSLIKRGTRISSPVSSLASLVTLPAEESPFTAGSV
jgi:hypothetical protein